ncbi:hypothetical protein [Hyphococcus sp.]|uniref:hypothetical protein n=1 Tax=Hyphococcus sp. TaxID=2038636 RepID=UPI003CCC4207
MILRSVLAITLFLLFMLGIVAMAVNQKGGNVGEAVIGVLPEVGLPYIVSVIIIILWGVVAALWDKRVGKKK